MVDASQSLRAIGDCTHGSASKVTRRPNWTKWPSDGYISNMSTHSIAKAKNQLSELIDRALKGEGVVITRHGHPVVELKPIPEPARAVSGADLDWLARRRIGRLSATKDAGKLVSAMRDEDER
jgi:prevent-host-death family protein